MRFLIYIFRWWVSAIVMMPIMYMFDGFPLWLNLLLAQTIGAIIFYGIDKTIFTYEKNHKKGGINEIYNNVQGK